MFPDAETLQGHRDYQQVVLDVNRSLKRFPPGEKQAPGIIIIILIALFQEGSHLAYIRILHTYIKGDQKRFIHPYQMCKPGPTVIIAVGFLATRWAWCSKAAFVLAAADKLCRQPLVLCRTDVMHLAGIWFCHQSQTHCLPLWSPLSLHPGKGPTLV